MSKISLFLPFIPHPPFHLPQLSIYPPGRNRHHHRLHRTDLLGRYPFFRCLSQVVYQEQHPLPGARSFISTSHSLIIPEAQPTPASTRMAVVGQFRAQAPHSIQASRSLRVAFLFAMVNTWCGQTSRHRPQPMQASPSSSTVVALSKYLKPFTSNSVSHLKLLISSRALTAIAPTMTGRLRRISFFTPVREV